MSPLYLQHVTCNTLLNLELPLFVNSMTDHAAVTHNLNISSRDVHSLGSAGQTYIVHYHSESHSTLCMVHFPSRASRLFVVWLIFATCLGVHSSPLTVTPQKNTVRELEQRDDRRFRNLPIRLLRKSKTGSIITNPDTTRVESDEDWAIFIGTDGIQAHPGPAGTLTAIRVPEARTNGGTLIKLQDLHEKASFTSSAEKAKVFQGLLTDVPALHKGNDVPKTNLAYLNGVFAYLASVKAVSAPQPPEAWVTIYNEMHNAKGDAS
ncbi:hypothetical protein C8J55DRAFT_567637 [Lentinula edodes]|uniref:Uncharacterized protein n=1 Tax=Lentinula lateritia TaxID=40482 RepID=A0A9W8ZQG1_9AGAR|nr:hypothetical protein C8J55DRAFT_567637 [Lentinula edodes]